MDIVDQAQEIEAEHLRRAFLHRQVAPVQVGIDCLACGQEIPAARRAAVPGCCLCVTCQDEAERSMGL